MEKENAVLEEKKKGLIITDVSREYLKSISNWSMFFGVLGFVTAGIFFILGVLIAIVSTIFDEFANSSDLPAVALIFAGILYIAFGLLYFFLSWYLCQFSKNMKSALNFNYQNDADEGFKNMNKVFKIWGIFTIVGIFLSIFLVFFSMIFTTAASILEYY